MLISAQVFINTHRSDHRLCVIGQTATDRWVLWPWVNLGLQCYIELNLCSLTSRITFSFVLSLIFSLFCGSNYWHRSVFINQWKKTYARTSPVIDSNVTRPPQDGEIRISESRVWVPFLAMHNGRGWMLDEGPTVRQVSDKLTCRKNDKSNAERDGQTERQEIEDRNGNQTSFH